MAERTAVPPVLKKSASTGSWHDCASLMKKVSFSWSRSGSLGKPKGLRRPRLLGLRRRRGAELELLGGCAQQAHVLRRRRLVT